ncbi:leucine-rich repeat-containing protein 42-like isoform X2 [Dreissena polymorpha]|uniref:leucine-rich repeat-containing protein 42-like isoform X2 n=1 Tax=Dreissena polymorpha TaxID=45954 RepID=UPI002264246A|nr:leucine-rich repeat-containing protein 42-like isoform X2 [Dreissena polymorpha]
MFSPQSLFDQCILFIAYNVDKVEDFVGFPSQIGEKIFSTAIMQPRFFDDHEYADQTLNVFSEAFGEELMYSLNMAGEHLCLNYHLEAILKFQDLHCLDLSHCGLGDNHELLQHIAHFYSLEQLCLKGNSITDAGIQKLTIPFRMFKHGPSRLSVVDLSGNTGVSVLCLKYFTQFPRLTRVVLSNGPSSKVIAERWMN